MISQRAASRKVSQQLYCYFIDVSVFVEYYLVIMKILFFNILHFFLFFFRSKTTCYRSQLSRQHASSNSVDPRQLTLCQLFNFKIFRSFSVPSSYLVCGRPPSRDPTVIILVRFFSGVLQTRPSHLSVLLWMICIT